MKTLVIFLNELSFTASKTVDEMRLHVLSTLAAIRSAKRIRNDLVVAGHVALSGVCLGDGTSSLSAILGGNEYKDEWRFLRILEQSSPWSAYPGLTAPGDLQEVTYGGAVATGMLWAKQNDSTVVSFAFLPSWEGSDLEAQFREMDGDGNLTSTDVSIRNLSNPGHVTTHREFIHNYGRSVSSSSLIYEGDGFVIRIWFYDHDPPHFHVLTRTNTSETLARYAIETLDCISGIPSAIRRRVEEWARDQKDRLMTSWQRCRVGRHPFSL